MVGWNPGKVSMEAALENPLQRLLQVSPNKKSQVITSGRDSLNSRRGDTSAQSMPSLPSLMMCRSNDPFVLSIVLLTYVMITKLEQIMGM